MGVQIPIDASRLDEFCRRNGIRRMAFFGSVLRPDFRPDSDVDVLVEFQPGKTPGYAFFQIQEELSRIIGRQVDMHTFDGLNNYIRDRVLREAQGVYDAA